MGRKRKKSDQWMPQRVYRGKSAYEFRPKGGGAVRLAPLGASKSAVWAEYERIVAESSSKGRFELLGNQYLSSEKFNALAPTTQKDYQKHAKKVFAVFGEMHPDKIEPRHIRQYMDLRGKNSKKQANLEKAFMSAVFSWAYERGKVKKNPCVGVRAFSLKSRDRYVTDEEYKAVFDHACPVVKAAMEIAYLCMARVGDVLKLKREQLLPEGIFICQGKTGKKQIKAWGPRLTKAVAIAGEINPKVGSIYVVHQASGAPYLYSGFRARWTAALKAAREATGLKLDFTFHDLKAKGISDFEGTDSEKQFASGHKTLAQVHTYNRKIPVVPTVESNSDE